MFRAKDVNRSPEIHYQQLGFGHFFDGVTEAFAAKAGILYAAVGHVIDAERGDVAGDDGANLKVVIGLKEQIGIPREDARLHAIGGAVHHAQRLIEIAIGLDGHDGSENFLAIYFHVRLSASENGGLDDEILAPTSAKQARSGANGFIDPGSGADSVALANDGAYVGGFVERVAG